MTFRRLMFSWIVTVGIWLRLASRLDLPVPRAGWAPPGIVRSWPSAGRGEQATARVTRP
jgi:hypothetical protein